MEEGEVKHIRESTENGRNQPNEKIENEELNMIKFLDSMDTYLIFINYVSSALRQSWLDLAGAKHSMGSSRISSVLFDLKYHNAATSVQVNEDDGSSQEPPHFKLCKWASRNQENNGPRESEAKDNELFLSKSGTPQLRCRSMLQNSESQEQMPENHRSSPVVDGQVQKEQSKSLSMFGILVSPKLQSAQRSFETALEMLVETANIRASLLSAYDEASKGMHVAK